MHEYNALCQTCLSIDRQLRPVKKIEDLLQNLQIALNSMSGGVCFECVAQMRNMAIFKTKVITSQNILRRLIPRQHCNNLSTLRTTQVNYYDYEITENDPLLHKSGHIKQEFRHNEENYVNCEETQVKYIDSSINSKVKEEIFENNFEIEDNPGDLNTKVDPKNYEYYKESKDVTASATFVATCSIAQQISKNAFQEEKLKLEKEHIKAHRRTCEQCGSTFKGYKTLNSHIKRVHGSNRQFICDICRRSFKTKSRLESHMSVHGYAQNLAYCALCKIQYKSIQVYRSHLRTSASHAETTHECNECKKKFASKIYLTKHYNFYHLRKSQYHCVDCDKPFISAFRLNNHRQTQHGLQRTRDHGCDVCGKQFFTQSTLRDHQLTHSDHRGFMCSDCGDTFKQRPSLYTHCRLVHRGGKAGKK